MKERQYQICDAKNSYTYAKTKSNGFDLLDSCFKLLNTFVLGLFNCFCLFIEHALYLQPLMFNQTLYLSFMVV